MKCFDRRRRCSCGNSSMYHYPSIVLVRSEKEKVSSLLVYQIYVSSLRPVLRFESLSGV